MTDAGPITPVQSQLKIVIARQSPPAFALGLSRRALICIVSIHWLLFSACSCDLFVSLKDAHTVCMDLYMFISQFAGLKPAGGVLHQSVGPSFLAVVAAIPRRQVFFGCFFLHQQDFGARYNAEREGRDLFGLGNREGRDLFGLGNREGRDLFGLGNREGRGLGSR